jgi:hypothetical protein
VVLNRLKNGKARARRLRQQMVRMRVFDLSIWGRTLGITTTRKRMKKRSKEALLAIRLCTMTSWKSVGSPRISNDGRLRNVLSARVNENLVPGPLQQVPNPPLNPL